MVRREFLELVQQVPSNFCQLYLSPLEEVPVPDDVTHSPRRCLVTVSLGGKSYLAYSYAGRAKQFRGPRLKMAKSLENISGIR